MTESVSSVYGEYRDADTDRICYSLLVTHRFLPYWFKGHNMQKIILCEMRFNPHEE